jgi:hypothetical protein
VVALFEFVEILLTQQVAFVEQYELPLGFAEMFCRTPIWVDCVIFISCGPLLIFLLFCDALVVSWVCLQCWKSDDEFESSFGRLHGHG